MPGNWRKAKKARTFSIFALRYPPLRPPIELAEWVKFPEKNADLWSLRPSFGGGGSPGWTAARLMAILILAVLPIR